MNSDSKATASLRDEIPRVDDAIAVGEDLDFQRNWWRFEKIAWILLALVLVADALGAFGRGWLARATCSTKDGVMQVDYERVERAGTPSKMTLKFGAPALQESKIRLQVSESLVETLGTQRVIPQPEVSAVGPAGVTYTFAATGQPATVAFALEPSFPGVHDVALTVAGEEPLRFRILVLP